MAEHVLSIRLAPDPFTRFTAPGLLVMPAVIQSSGYPDAGVAQGLWAAAFLARVARGPWSWSLNRVSGPDGACAASAQYGLPAR
jgi:hypothetical protein